MTKQDKSRHDIYHCLTHLLVLWAVFITPLPPVIDLFFMCSYRVCCDDERALVLIRPQTRKSDIISQVTIWSNGS